VARAGRTPPSRCSGRGSSSSRTADRLVLNDRRRRTPRITVVRYSAAPKPRSRWLSSRETGTCCFFPFKASSASLKEKAACPYASSNSASACWSDRAAPGRSGRTGRTADARAAGVGCDGVVAWTATRTSRAAARAARVAVIGLLATRASKLVRSAHPRCDALGRAPRHSATAGFRSPCDLVVAPAATARNWPGAALSRRLCSLRQRRAARGARRLRCRR